MASATHSDSNIHELEENARQILLQTQKNLLTNIKAIQKNIDRKIKGK